MAVEAPLGPWPYVASSPEMQKRVHEAKVLVVGAGGIGCELLKTLVMTGFTDIHVVDLDTIDTSNLNRQFLFRKRHVGQSKAAVAAAAAAGMRAGVRITPYQGNIKEARFGLDFFRGFDLVLDGLDNVDARRHTNRLCLAAGVPLVESGTQGFLGQVTVHMKGVTECYECTAKAAPKSYPVCTIRNTPDKPIHCVVWAKELLFPRLFGPPDAATDLDDTAEAAERGDGEAAVKDDVGFFQLREGEASGEYAQRVFRRVFSSDIQQLLGVEELWKARPPPCPLDLDAITTSSSNGAAAATNGSSNGGGRSGESAVRALGLGDTHAVWDLRQNGLVFLEAVQQYLDGRPEQVGSAEFDKDDDLAVEFVTAAANLRALCYGIQTQSLFATKGMAGNIIHAVATTNAVVSGLIVLEALKLLSGNRSACASVYLHQSVSKKKLLVPEIAQPPKPGCLVCGTAQARLALNTETTTLQQLLDKVMRKRFSLIAPSLMCGGFRYEEGEDLEPYEVKESARHLPTLLAALPGGGIRHGSVVEVEDQEQHFHAQLLVEHVADLDLQQYPEGFMLAGDLPAAQAPPLAEPAAGGAAQPAAGAKAQVREGDDGAVLLDSDDDMAPAVAAAGRPAKRGAEEVADGGGKRARVAAGTEEAAGEDVIDLLDD